MLFSILNLIIIGMANDLSKSDWASWVQAIGSIGAIIGTWYATSYHWEKTEAVRLKESRLAAVDLVDICVSVALDALRVMRNIERNFKNGTNPIGTERLEEMQWLRRQRSTLHTRHLFNRTFAISE